MSNFTPPPQEPMCLSYSRDSDPREDGKRYTTRHLSNVVNSLCPGRRESNEILILEPMEQAEPQMLARQRTEEARQLRKQNGDVGVSFSGSKEYTMRQDGMSNTLTSTVQKDNLVAEPQVKSIGNRNPSGHGIGGEVYDTQGLAPTLCVNKGSGYTVAEPQSCAIRTRTYAGKPATIEMGKDVANALTSVQKDSMVAEPTIQNVGNIYPSGGQGGKVVATTGLAPAVCECHGEVTRIVEPTMLQPNCFTGERRFTENDVTQCMTSAKQRQMYLKEPQERTIAYKEMPNGNIRAYDPNTKDLRGISESQITNPNNEAPTVTTSNEPKIMEQQPKYRIRKLTPRECYRLMDVEDSDIDKLLYPIDEKGKPIIPKSQHYKLAGNSIVVSCLYHLFRRLFIDTEPTEPIQLELF